MHLKEFSYFLESSDWAAKSLDKRPIEVKIFTHYLTAEVNISSYPATDVAGLFFFCRAEILNSGGFVQKYSDQGVSCKNIGQ